MARSKADVVVDSAGVGLAVRDYGGSGPAVVLLHGLGRTVLDWELIAPLLLSTHHVVSFDLRCHGQSDDGPWSWDAALADIAAVARQLKLDNPALVGHSLGGMLAVMWGERHPESPGVVNLDGHGKKHPDQYLGMSPDEAVQREAQLNALVQQSLQALAGPLREPQIDALLAQQRSLAEQLRLPPEVLIEAARRGLRTQGGETRIRPAVGGVGSDILAMAEGFDMIALYPRVRCPVLIINGTTPELGAGPEWIKELMAAYRQGIARDLAMLAQSHPNIRVENVPASHALVFEQPEAIADEVQRFLA